MVYTFFDKKTSGSVLKMKNKESAEELHEAIIRNLIKTSTFTFYTGYLGCRFRRHAIDK